MRPRLFGSLALLTQALALAPSAPAASSAPVTASGDSTRTMLPVVTSSVRPNTPWRALQGPPIPPARVRVHVDAMGVVDSAVVIAANARVRAAALDAARWFLFAPALEPAWTEVEIAFPSSADADPLSPDPVSMARAAEKAGDLNDAIDNWTGALARVGRHITLLDDHAVREHILRLASRLPGPRQVPNMAAGPAQGAKAQLDRNMSRAVSADMVTILDASLAVAPWYRDAYRWRASALAGCGRVEDARRSVLLYRLTADSAGAAVATRALRALAHRDTVLASQLMKF